MRKIILLSSILCLFISAEATARIDISVGLFGEPAPAYIEAPYYSSYPVYPTYVEEPARYHEQHNRHVNHGKRQKHENRRR